MKTIVTIIAVISCFVFCACEDRVYTPEYQLPEIVDGLADLHYDKDSDDADNPKNQLMGYNWYFVAPKEVKLDPSASDRYEIQVKFLTLNSSDTLVVRFSDDNLLEEAGGSNCYEEIVPKHIPFAFIKGDHPEVEDTLKLRGKEIKIRIIDSNNFESEWFSTILQDAQDDNDSSC